MRSSRVGCGWVRYRGASNPTHTLAALRDHRWQQQIGRSEIGGKGDVMHIAHPLQALNIWLVRVRVERINQKDQQRNFAIHHPCCNLASPP